MYLAISLNFLVVLIDFSRYIVILSTVDYFVTFFLVLRHFNFMSCLIAWDRTSEIILNINGKSDNEFYDK